MSSFYGRGGNGGMSTKDYNALVNTPIQNIGGSGIFDLSTLTTGHYNLQGNYKYDSTTSIEHINTSQLDLLVLNDTETSNHVISFTTFENGEVFLNNLVYDANNVLVEQDRKSLTNPSISWGSI